MRIFQLALLSLFFSPLAIAEGLLPTTQLNSQVDNEENLRRCINQATAGADMSFANAAKKDKCFIPLKFVCLLFGHGEKSEPAWNTDGMNYTRATQSCFGARTTTVKFAQNMVGTTGVAVGKIEFDATGASVAAPDFRIPGLAGKDPNFDSTGKFIGKDGSSFYGLADGEITNRALMGENIEDILKNSPVGLKMTAAEKEARFADPKKFNVGNGNGAVAETTGASAAPSGGGKGADMQDLLADLGLGGESEEEAKKLAELSAEEQAAAAEAKELAAKQEQERLLTKYSTTSRTIFQMVRSQYKRQSPQLLTIDFRVLQKQAEKTKEYNRAPASLDKL